MKKRLLVLALVILSIFSIACTRNQTARRQNQNRTAQKQAIGGVESSVFQLGDIDKIKITSDVSNIRTGVSPDSPVLQTTNKNNTHDVLSKVGDWYAVKLPDNKIGFVPSGDCKAIVSDDKKPAMPPSAAGTTPQAPNAPKTPSANNTYAATSEEQQMLKLINEARAQNNVQPLKLDTEVSNCARVKAQDMIDNNYFSHNSPKYGSPFDMMKSFGINYVAAGENIAGNQNVANAHNSLMNSPGHRRNILNPDFTHIGLGIKKGGPYGNMFCQMFISKPQ
ncbi:cysteine-rich secretory protein family protein [Clostridium homopropionicum DSM 5847]|uniref:Cysteine-rich secretory protein family protein n=1 Tax=Clostridium homopropionicum DSM 5847 TaxID=1121318 RepID=A0A0L6ZBL4_9CLOT|nr:CAP domain-containing protein [Clostridium homopropionicum]KOA20374.1 cysteine-rich secretory protein family protein [Clostridium homopropionicum DSM 5847]SFG74494.1 uncharacterized protein, YkwD family [Clostridium homopropionicum]